MDFTSLLVTLAAIVVVLVLTDPIFQWADRYRRRRHRKGGVLDLTPASTHPFLHSDISAARQPELRRKGTGR